MLRRVIAQSDYHKVPIAHARVMKFILFSLWQEWTQCHRKHAANKILRTFFVFYLAVLQTFLFFRTHRVRIASVQCQKPKKKREANAAITWLYWKKKPVIELCLYWRPLRFFFASFLPFVGAFFFVCERGKLVVVEPHVASKEINVMAKSCARMKRKRSSSILPKNN